MESMKRIAFVIGALFTIACSGSQTSPTPPPVVVVNPVPPVVPPVVTPPVTPVPNPMLADPRFNLAFYRQFVLNGYEQPGSITSLRRQTQAPRIYLRTIDDVGAPMDALTLEQTAAALESTTGQLTGLFGVAGMERGTDTKQGQPGWITVRWSAVASPENFCGFAPYAGDVITLYPRTLGCRCAGGPAVRLKTVRHELGHALGFYHTGDPTDLMFQGGNACDRLPSAREQFHAQIAYSQAIGSRDPR